MNGPSLQSPKPIPNDERLAILPLKKRMSLPYFKTNYHMVGYRSLCILIDSITSKPYSHIISHIIYIIYVSRFCWWHIPHLYGISPWPSQPTPSQITAAGDLSKVWLLGEAAQRTLQRHQRCLWRISAIWIWSGVKMKVNYEIKQGCVGTSWRFLDSLSKGLKAAPKSEQRVTFLQTLLSGNQT